MGEAWSGRASTGGEQGAHQASAGKPGAEYSVTNTQVPSLPHLHSGGAQLGLVHTHLLAAPQPYLSLPPCWESPNPPSGPLLSLLLL